MEFFIYLIIFLILLPFIIILIGFFSGFIRLIYITLRSKAFPRIFILVLIAAIPSIFIWDRLSPVLVPVIVNNAIKIYPTEQCRRKTLFEYKKSDFEYLDGYGSDSTEIIVRDYFEQLYYKNCAPQKSAYCSFKYYGDPINMSLPYVKDVEFNPKLYYATCYNKKPEFKDVKVPLIKRWNYD